MPPSDLRPSLSLLGAGGLRAGEERFALLEAIERAGSISGAARDVELSYKAAWAAVHALNNLFPRPLVAAQSGGQRGGGAALTEEGRQVLAAHRQLSSALTRVLASLEAAVATDGTQSFDPRQLWNIGMKTSARNTFHGTITAVTDGAVNSEVTLRISEDTELSVIVTRRSVADLGLQVGGDAFALIKASTPILMADEGDIRVSARNRIAGTVLSVEPGAVNSEVLIDIGGGKTLAVIVTQASVEHLGLEPGDRVRALIKASQVILGVSAV